MSTTTSISGAGGSAESALHIRCVDLAADAVLFGEEIEASQIAQVEQRTTTIYIYGFACTFAGKFGWLLLRGCRHNAGAPSANAPRALCRYAQYSARSAGSLVFSLCCSKLYWCIVHIYFLTWFKWLLWSCFNVHSCLTAHVTGLIGVRLWIYDAWQTVWIDDYIPCSGLFCALCLMCLFIPPITAYHVSLIALLINIAHLQFWWYIFSTPAYLTADTVWLSFCSSYTQASLRALLGR